MLYVCSRYEVPGLIDVCREKLAQTHLLWEEQQEITKSRRVRLEQDLSKETSAWITSVDQIDARITEDLFSKEAGSTGYATKYSNLWKYQVSLIICANN